MQRFALLVLMCAALPAAQSSAQSSAQHDAKTALAGQFVRHAIAYCGYEPSRRGEVLGTTEFGQAHAADQQFAEALWRGTFACEKAYIGTSCMAARWALCQRTFAEYGPDGVLVRGLLKPIIHK